MSKLYMSQHEWHPLVQHTNARMIFLWSLILYFFHSFYGTFRFLVFRKQVNMKKKNIMTVNIIVIYVTKELILIPVHMICLITMNVHTFTENSDNVCCKDHNFL